jgi:hypothetical protein
MTQITSRKVAFGEPIFPQQPRFSSAEISQLQAENKLFADRCREVFQRVAPDLIEEHYDWYIIVEPESGDYFIDPDEIVAFHKAQEKHNTSMLYAMRLNETGSCGSI